MNGKEMLESMSYVDEKYIADAEVRPKGRLHWQPVAAAAACLALVLVGVGLMAPGRETPMELAAGPRQAAAQLEEAASGDTADQGMPLMAAAPKSVALPEMTVTVVAREGSTLHCTVETSGDGAFQPGQEITVLLPQEDAEALPTRLHIFYTPAEAADTVTALSWEEAQDVPQE